MRRPTPRRIPSPLRAVRSIRMCAAARSLHPRRMEMSQGTRSISITARLTEPSPQATIWARARLMGTSFALQTARSRALSRAATAHRRARCREIRSTLRAALFRAAFAAALRTMVRHRRIRSPSRAVRSAAVRLWAASVPTGQRPTIRRPSAASPLPGISWAAAQERARTRTRCSSRTVPILRAMPMPALSAMAAMSRAMS